MLEYLKRVLLHNAPLAAPQDVAAILASYAHDARLRIEQAELPALASLRQALEDALGLRFEGDKGRAFLSLNAHSDPLLRSLLGLGAVGATARCQTQ